MDPHLAHAVNVGILSCVLGQLCRLNIGQINSLCIAAFLHDLGRIIIPPEWAMDPTPLSEAEKAIVRQHTDWGFMLLAAHGELPPQAALAACRHHDRNCQRKGYQPDIFERIISLVDAYDLGLYGEKFYWKKRRKDRILTRLLNQRGAEHGPALVKLLVNTVGYYPVGSLVRLDDGQRAIVIRPSPMNPARPKVYLFEAAKQDAAEQPPIIADLEELADGGTGFKRSVKAVLGPDEAVDIPKILDAKKEFLLSFAL
jgi:HD-GYP domain-containing protein (c-di-GMP phosphodiesterase class II)